jgi:hypothetical protein
VTIDERIERLTERHEAFAQSVEILVAENPRIVAENRQRDRQLGEIMEGIARLVHVAEIHEHRLTELEGGQS